ncbi:hypothetical protein RB653_002843 [Dictyostelium firmibasis]|uniref:EGF-like domain-containing protein n=1 Tax=Dictyostelium firmibasis TaxID=79012 RepID=A0AAN7YZ08_9MYCE
MSSLGNTSSTSSSTITKNEDSLASPIKSSSSTITKNEDSSIKSTPFYSDQVIFVDGKTYNRKFTISKAFLDLDDPPGVKQSFHKFVHRNRILIFSLILLYLAIDGKNHGITKLIHHASVLRTIFVMYAMSFLVPLFNYCYQKNYFSKWLFRKDNKIALFSVYLMVQFIIGTWSAYFILYRQIYPLGTQFYLGMVAIVISWKQHSYFIVTNYENLHKKKVKNNDKNTIIHKKTDGDNQINNNNKNNNISNDEKEKIIEFNKEISKRQISYNDDFKTFWEISKDYFLYLFTPTLIYDQYYEVRKASKSLKPEPLKTRFISLIKELYSSMVIMMTAHYIILSTDVEYIFPALTERLDIYSYLKILIPAEINFQLQYYLLYHCALSLLADLTGFNDRLSFYNDYWAAVTTKSILTQWSKPVHNWLYRHMFSDMKSLFKIKTVICLFTTMVFSGFFHEFIVTSITKQICMPWSTFSLISCAMFIMVENKFPKLTNSAYYHAFVRVLLVVGHGLFYFSYFYFCFSDYDIGYYRDLICLNSFYSNLQLTNRYNETSFCNTSPNSCVIVYNKTYVNELFCVASNNSYEIKYEDIQCFSKVTRFFASNCKISYDIFFKPYPTLDYVLLSNVATDYNRMFSSPIDSNITYLLVENVPTPIITSINLSSIKSSKQFNFNLKTIEGSSVVQLINDLPVDGKINKIPYIYMNNLYDLPNMDNIECLTFSVGSFKEPTGGYSNIPTLRNIEVFSISSSFTMNLYPFSFIPKNNTLKSIVFSGKEIITSVIVDLSNLTSLYSLTIDSNLTNFRISTGKIPLVLPKSLQTFNLKGGSGFSDVGEFMLNYPNLLFINLQKNNLTGNFSKWKNNGFSSLDISDNSLQGTIDSSWCSSLLNVSNNQLSGSLPSCFTCHLQNSNLVKNMLKGNLFSNPTPICTTLIPNLRYVSTLKKIELYGQDLGFSHSDIIPSPIFNFGVMNKPSTLFTSFPSPSSLPQIINITFKGANQTYTLSTIQKEPSVVMITPTINTKQLSFDGSFFNYNKSSFSILVDSYKCNVDSASFYQVNCTIESNTYNSNTISIIKINVNDYYYYNLMVLTTTVFAYLDQVSFVKNCTSNCPSLGGICNTLTGQCYFECPNNCTNSLSGTCDTSNGNCNCTSNSQGLDCSLPFIPCSSNCSEPIGNGICNNQTGICSCTVGLQGEDCSIPSHYITSIIPCSTDGGEVSIDGWFGNDYDGTHTLSYYTVIIGQLDCIVTSINKSTIKCNLGSGTGTKNIKIINTKHTNVIFNGIGLFNYQNQIKTCPNNCSGTNNGKCNSNTGECECINKFTGFDCSLSIPTLPQPSTNSTVNNTGEVELNNQDTKYEISILSLNEISFDGSIIISHQLNRNWSIDSNNTELNKFKFSQTLINNTCTITYMIEEIKNENKKFTFGTTTFTIEKDSIKLSVSINNYQYQSTLNTLQLVFYSAVSTNTDSTDNYNNECNKKEALIDTSEVNNQQVSSYIQISKNSKILVGRFINQVISDSRATFMSSTIIKDNNDSSTSTSTSSIKLGLNLPHCNECLIDPDFSVLVSPDFKQSCNDGSNKNKWLIPVAVVVPVVGCALIFLLELSSKYNSTNYCTSNDIKCTNLDNQLYVYNLENIVSINSYVVTLEDIQCFSKIYSLQFSNFNISSNLLQGPFPALIQLTLSNCTTNYTQMFSSQIATNLNTIYINDVQSPIEASINLSSVQKLFSFSFYIKENLPTNEIKLINDYPVSDNGSIYLKPQYFYVDTNDFPNMDNIGYESFTMRSYSPPNQGYKYIQTIKNIKLLSFNIEAGSIDFNQFSLIPKNNSILNLYYWGSQTKILTAVRVDLSNLTLMGSLQIKGDLSGFNINGKIPLILHNSVNRLIINSNGAGGSFSDAGEFLSNYPNISYVDLNNNNMTGNFSLWKNVGYSNIILQNNRLYGGVDSTWCTSLLNINYNQLSGPLPSCFTCHFQSDSVKSLVNNTGGNTFTNINPPPPCTTIIPNLRYESSSLTYGYLYLYGQDLGFYSNDIIISSPPILLVLKTPSSLFSSYVQKSILTPHIDITFKAPNQTYRLSTIQKAPIVNKITPTIITKQLTIDGSFFNYNKSSFNILVDHYQCITDSSTFYQVNCTMAQSSNYNENIISKITINVNDYYYKKLTVLTTTVFAYLNQTTTITNCTSDCTPRGGICNSIINQCYFECPNNCTNALSGTCDTSTGSCNCTSNSQGLDCSLPFIPCSSNCSEPIGNGICNNQTGICSCTVGLQGEDCSIPSHYITSVIPCSTDGGEVSIDGWFGNDNDGTHTLSSYTVIIGQLDCIVTSINKSTIKCNLGSGTGTKNIKIINTKHTNVIFNGIGLFNYQNQIKTCPNNCSGTSNGKCNSNTGECECNNKFTGYDCSLSIPTSPQPSTNSTVNNTGGVTINNQDTKYEISILSLNEISFDGSIIISHQLNRNWSIDSNNTELNKFKFSQTLINNTCTITYMIEEIKNENKKFTFGTTTFTIEKDSIKLSVSINNYQYQSTLNTLQLVFYSAVSTNTDSTDNNNNECNKKEASIDTSEVNNQQVSNYIQISKNSKILVGRFINQVISDSRATFMSSTIIKDNNDSSTSTSSIKLGLNLPHCNECLIDPDFSVLVSPDFKQSCNDDDKSKKWLIPVAVVVPVVGCSLIAIIVFIIYKKNRINVKIVALKLKPFKNKQ